jgi:hypothetical protein
VNPLETVDVVAVITAIPETLLGIALGSPEHGVGDSAIVAETTLFPPIRNEPVANGSLPLARALPIPLIPVLMRLLGLYVPPPGPVEKGVGVGASRLRSMEEEGLERRVEGTGPCDGVVCRLERGTVGASPALARCGLVSSTLYLSKQENNGR